MRRLTFFYFLMAASAVAQNPAGTPPTTTTNPNGNACQANAVLNFVPSGVIYTCQNGTMAVATGSSGGSLPVVAFNPNTATSLTCPGTSGAQFKASTTLTGASTSIATVSCAPATGTAVPVQFVVSQGATVYALSLPSPFDYCDFTKMGINDTMTQVGTYDGTVYRGGSCDVASGVGNVATTDELPASVTGIRKSAGAGTTDAAAAAADVYGLWSGTKDSSHCMAGDGTMQTCTGGGASGQDILRFGICITAGCGSETTINAQTTNTTGNFTECAGNLSVAPTGSSTVWVVQKAVSPWTSWTTLATITLSVANGLAPVHVSTTAAYAVDDKYRVIVTTNDSGGAAQGGTVQCR